MHRPSGFALAAVVLACCAGSPARAGWNGDPVQISTAAPIPLVEACNDGDHGTFVAWQESSMLRVQHLLPSGDLDPAWPASGTIARDVAADRTNLALLPDGLGGLYLSWRESQSLYLTRLDAAGQTPAAWPAQGRNLGPAAFPALIGDGAHGVFAAWTSSTDVLMIHLGPENSGAGGWSNGAHVVRTPDGLSADTWPALAPDDAGGAYLSWLRLSQDEQVVPSAACILRLGPDGQPASGWPGEGVAFPAFYLSAVPALGARLVDVARDGNGGAYLLVCEPVQETTQFDPRLRRLTPTGELAPGWPVEGHSTLGPVEVYDAEAAPRVRFGEAGSAIVSTPFYYSEGITEMNYLRYPDAGDIAVPLASAEPHLRSRVVGNGEGGLYIAMFKPSGPWSMYEAYAHLRLVQGPAPAGWSDWSETYTNPVIQIYGDIGLAATGDGGAVLFWSQMYDRVGLFARRYGPAGETTDVPPATASFGIESARFQPGAGVRVRCSTGAGGPARLDLFDIAGRRVAGARAHVAPGAGETAIPGTAGLPSGLYFVRLVAGGAEAHARVGVTR